MDSSVSPKDEIWFLRVCHHVSNAVYIRIAPAGVAVRQLLKPLLLQYAIFTVFAVQLVVATAVK
jgi:hypothetical protein